MKSDRRILMLPLAAVILCGVCWWRVTYPPHRSAQDAPDFRLPAPAFQLYDRNSKVVNLDAYLHRHTIVIAFYDGQAGPDADRTLEEIRRFYAPLKQAGVVAFGVSTALPQENRNNARKMYPFPLLSDVDAVSARSAHKLWGRFVRPPTLDQPPGTIPGVFIIDRSGLVSCDPDSGIPRPEPDPDRVVPNLLGG